MTTMTTEVEELLAAGAVLPLDATGAGEQAVPLTARTYRHPVLDDRPVVRLVAAELGIAEDAATGFLGLDRTEEPLVVGLGQRQSLGFPEWVLVHHPDDGREALAIVPETKRIAQQARSKPKLAVEAYHALAGRLARSVPHFLPTFYEQAGRVFLDLDEETWAGQMFNRARKAEAEHGLTVDPDRLDGVYLEFALAGALSATTLAGYAKDLAARLPADQALDRFCQLCVRSVAAGLVPAAQTSTTVRRLVRAAAKAGDAAGAEERERAYLIELIGLPATLKATAWWKAHLPELVKLAGHDRSVRGTLLNLMPRDDYDGDVIPQWLDILVQTGAAEGLVDGALPASERPADGSSGWLRRLLESRHASSYRTPRRLPALYELVTGMAGRLRAELAESGATVAAVADLDLVDLLLSLDVPVSDPESRNLPLDTWANGEGQRDLLGVAGDARFRAALLRLIPLPNNGSGRQVMGRLADSPGGRPVLAEWVRARAQECHTAGLPDLGQAAELILALPGEALALAPDEVAAVAGIDLAEAVARALRGGIYDELGWPAWEEALADVVGGDHRLVADAWPYLVVGGPARARVIDADGTVLSHDLRIPAGDIQGGPQFQYVDGALLVYWTSRELDYESRGYWHTSADAPQPMPDMPARDRRSGNVTLPVPGGGRTTGDGPLHVGDTVLPIDRPVISDGTSYWVRAHEKAGGYQWREFDPTTGTCGRPSLPGFLADALTDAPSGSTLRDTSSWLLPAPTDRVTPLGVPVDGLLGWRVVNLPDGSKRGEDLAGRSVTVSRGVPVAALTLPGDDRPRAVLDDLSLVDPDGVVSAAAGQRGQNRDYTPDAIPLPPRNHWHQLRPRDPQGSVALRRIDHETAAALLKGATEVQSAKPAEADAKADAKAKAKAKAEAKAARTEALLALVRTTLPQLTHDEVRAGVVGVLRFAVARQATLDNLAERLRKKPAARPAEEPVTGPTDGELHEAMDGLLGSGHHRSRAEGREVMRQLRAIRRAVAAPLPDPLPELHHEGTAVPHAPVNWPVMLAHSAALAYRAVAATTVEPSREALRALLTGLDELGLTASDQWRRFTLHLADSHLTLPDGKRRAGNWRGTLPIAEGTFLSMYHHQQAETTSPGYRFSALYRDPTGAFAVPAPYTVHSSAPVGDDRPAGWLGSFLAEWATRGPLPWLPEAVDRFVELTGVTPTVGKLVLAGMLQVDTEAPLSAETRKLLKVKATEVAYAFRTLDRIGRGVRRDVVAALLPEQPARLWTEGPDVAAAAAVWNAAVGRTIAVPEQLLADAAKSVRTSWGPEGALPALLDPAGSPVLNTDLVWTVRGDRVVPVDGKAKGFTADILVGAVATAAWVAQHTPAGDPVRAALPGALAAVRDRLANPDLLLGLGKYVRLDAFRKVAGAPTETGDGWERYGAVVLATHDDQPDPGIKVALLDEAGSDPFLPALRGGSQRMFPVETALWLARDPGFAALLADPGDPVAGTRDATGTWWPQDPARSVPDLVAEVAEAHGLGGDAAALYLTVLALPDPTDRNVTRWTGWKPTRFKAAHAELAGTDLVVRATRARAGRSLFLPCAWFDNSSPRLPIEQWKVELYRIPGQPLPPFDTTLPLEPVPDLYRRAWQRLRDGDVPRFEELRTPGRTRR
ncbi:DNA-binding protein [Plantactinospora mayteni]|uniref:DNA-binding protein n=1 Tax=Plantactinospora mayteni TaxID=566021 RepID=A0ABQ4ERP6_9ACTN|nr:hypothetical protein [Plantactinospora mayteni]GIG97308.1 DNA-binding protein [Plantactinospora mayteni]